jgi:hypothetical protein
VAVVSTQAERQSGDRYNGALAHRSRARLHRVAGPRQRGVDGPVGFPERRADRIIAVLQVLGGRPFAIAAKILPIVHGPPHLPEKLWTFIDRTVRSSIDIVDEAP